MQWCVLLLSHCGWRLRDMIPHMCVDGIVGDRTDGVRKGFRVQHRASFNPLTCRVLWCDDGGCAHCSMALSCDCDDSGCAHCSMASFAALRPHPQDPTKGLQSLLRALPDGAVPRATYVKGDRVVVVKGDLSSLEGAGFATLLVCGGEGGEWGGIISTCCV